MRVLIACEKSGVVCNAFRAKGHEAYSCDVLPTDGNPAWHIQDDVLNCLHLTWDLLIAHPPCDHLAKAGAGWWRQKREDGRQADAIEFFYRLASAGVPRICIENPAGVFNGRYINRYLPELIRSYLWLADLPRKPEQIVHPYHFGDPYRKETCLWLYNLPPLVINPDNVVTPLEFGIRNTPTGARRVYWQDNLSKKNRKEIRSKTFPGIARAMARQWG